MAYICRQMFSNSHERCHLGPMNLFRDEKETNERSENRDYAECMSQEKSSNDCG